jgi:pilus assembly protein CpaB
MKAARVVVLTIAVAAGGVAALLAGRSEKPVVVTQVAAPKVDTVDILVAKEDIPTGKELAPSDVQWQAWPASTSTGNFIRKTDRPDAIEKMSGLIVRMPFVTGEPIREEKLVNAKGSGYMAAILPSGMRAVSTQISPETGAGGFILPNDHVDVILTQRDRAAEKATGNEVQVSETILSNIRVLAIDQTVQDKNGQKVVVGKTATLELSPRQVETLVLAQRLGQLSLALRSITDAENNTAPKPDDSADSGHRTGVNVIRFGVSTPTTTQ